MSKKIHPKRIDVYLNEEQYNFIKNSGISVAGFVRFAVQDRIDRILRRNVSTSRSGKDGDENG